MSETIESCGEVELIRRLAARLAETPELRLGIGDDTAIVPGPAGTDQLLTSDAVVEGSHFLPDTEPEQIGHKAIARNISDIAAMGGRPQWALINLVAPKSTSVERLERVYDGAQRVASEFGLAVIGGDTTHGPVLELHVFLVGQVPEGTALLRSGARPGDRLFVTGELGGSLAGRHLTFTPRVEEAEWLREQGWARAMIDVSDGLATDLRHILARSEVGAILNEASIPLSAAAKAAADGRSALDHALCDGEDFELLFSVSEERVGDLPSAWRERFDLACTEIGRVTDEPGQLLLQAPGGTTRLFEVRGYDHFR